MFCVIIANYKMNVYNTSNISNQNIPWSTPRRNVLLSTMISERLNDAKGRLVPSGSVVSTPSRLRYWIVNGISGTDASGPMKMDDALPA